MAASFTMYAIPAVGNSGLSQIPAVRNNTQSTPDRAIMNNPPIPAARAAAALIAVTPWAGLLIQFASSLHLLGSILPTLWALLWYFTVLTNLLVAIVFTAIAAGRSTLAHPSIVAATTLYILLVGITYGLLLHGLLELSGGSAIANVILHMVTPALVPIFWIIFTPKGKLSSRNPLRWAPYPLGYLLYALIRGELTGRYPYPFLNVNQLGWPHTLLNALIIAIAFLAAAWLFVCIDSLLARRASHP